MKGIGASAVPFNVLPHNIEQHLNRAGEQRIADNNDTRPISLVDGRHGMDRWIGGKLGWLGTMSLLRNYF
ncbi:hypothetical protein RGR602_CH03056 [Rhizobium gallicum bv. gallicum R602sp]|uniref:Uncharacterized protein n=1 Tax=Rhizobium gallicum bv. gallicum R602sp TaxID=1041138 RepID=A0A0B4X726_9HYPH|nr:hypothetical protein [Rhizobium gallicum]AJD42373.1 hypothetical protein RGR602_CH03056 [Rhizobium gallicum bv. gallicum R602sp]